jgi:hypothetical protein
MKFNDILQTRINLERLLNYRLDEDGDLQITLDFEVEIFLEYNSEMDRDKDLEILDSKLNIK